MSVSFVFIGILVMLDVLFLVNYLAVKWIRTWTDQREEQLELEEQQSLAKNSAGDVIQSSCLSNMCNRSSSPPRSTTAYVQAFFMDVVHREPTSVMKFEKWRDLPFACGKWSTVALLLLSLSLLSVEFTAHDKINGGMQVAPRNLCRATDFSGKLDRFESEMSTAANLNLSRKQFNWTEGFYKALVKDTALYGTDGYECADRDGVSGSKYDWTNTDKDFFPEYCTARIQAEVTAASQAKCARECECAKVLGIKVCWLAKICVEVPGSCPEDTEELETNLNGYYSETEELYDAEVQHEANMNQTMPNTSDGISAAARTIEKVMYQVNVASVAYAFYSLLGLFFPAPLLMFRLPYAFYVKRYLFGIHKPTFILFVLALWWGIEYFRPFLSSPEIQLYLQMLRIGDPCLFDSNFIMEKVSVIKDICEELITMESRFVTSTLAINRLSAGVDLFVNSCNCTFPNKNLVRFQTPEYIFKAQAEELGFVREMDGLCESPSCNRIFLPQQDNQFLGETSFCRDTTIARQYLYAATSDDVETNWWYLLWTTGFLSKILIKIVATNFCIRLYHLADPLSRCGGRFEWPPGRLFRGHGDAETGSKDSVSPTGMSSYEARKLRSRKTRCLRIISLKWAIVWGSLTHVCLLNLALSPIEDEKVGMEDLLVGFIFLGIAFTLGIILICLGFLLKCRGKAEPSDDNTKSYYSLQRSSQNERASPLLETSSSSSSSTTTTTSSSSKEKNEDV